MITKTTFPFEPMDIFFLRDKSLLGRGIDAVEGGSATITHCGVVVRENGDDIETTATHTALDNLGADDAGSDMLCVRVLGMTPERALAGISAIKDQVGKLYPYGRFLMAVFHVREGAKTANLDCVGIAATALDASGYPLKRPVLAYYPQGLADELVGSVLCKVILDGSQRALGYIVDVP